MAIPPYKPSVVIFQIQTKMDALTKTAMASSTKTINVSTKSELPVKFPVDMAALIVTEMVHSTWMMPVQQPKETPVKIRQSMVVQIAIKMVLSTKLMRVRNVTTHLHLPPLFLAVLD